MITDNLNQMIEIGNGEDSIGCCGLTWLKYHRLAWALIDATDDCETDREIESAICDSTKSMLQAIRAVRDPQFGRAK